MCRQVWIWQQWQWWQQVMAASNGTKISQCNMAWGDFHGLGVHYINSLILADALLPLDGGRRVEENKKIRKKIALGEECFLGLDSPCCCVVGSRC
jgi:hypothetical protein